MAGQYECNECKGPIRWDARRCMHCGVIFNDTDERIEWETTKTFIKIGFWVLVIGFLLYKCS